jgi:hypothetical protein
METLEKSWLPKGYKVPQDIYIILWIILIYRNWKKIVCGVGRTR